MHGIIKTHIKFNQSWHFNDQRTGGHCFCYTALFFTYISIFHLKDQPVEYFAFLDVLNNIPTKEKEKFKREKQYRHAMDNEIAALNSNKEGFGLKELSGFKQHCQSIFDNLRTFEKPSFYFFEHYYNTTNKLFGYTITHTVGIYIASPKQIHFFDSISGLYILNLPDNYLKEHLYDDLIELIFKKDFMRKHFVDLQSRTLMFFNYESHFTNEEKNRNQEARDFLCSYISDPNVDYQLTSFPIEIQDFLKLNMYVIQQINKKMENKQENTITKRYVKYGVMIGIAAIGASFFAHRLLQKNAPDLTADLLKHKIG